MRVDFGEWTPDNPSLASSALDARNVYPKTARSYGPLTGLSEYSNAIDGYARGAISARKYADGVSYTFAGDSSKLYALSGTTFSDVSVSGGYSLTEYDRWEMVQFGDNVIATSFSDDIQSYDLGTLPATFDVLSADAPRARHIGLVKDFIMLGNTWDATFGYKPNRVWWPAINDPTTWPTPGTQAAYNVQSDFQDLPTGGSVTGVCSGCGGVDGVIICETAIHTAVYAGAPYVFTFNEADQVRGSNVPGSIAHIGTAILYLAEDGWYAFNGTSSVPIGADKVDKWFFSNFAQQYAHRLTNSVDPINKIVLWSFPDGNDGDAPNRVLIYNWNLRRWSHGYLTCDMLLRLRTEGVSPDSWDAVYGSPDTMTESPDSRIFMGGKLVLSAFSTDHKLSFFTGDALEATITTGELGDDGGRMSFVTGVRPLVEGGADAVVSLSYRDDQADTPTTGAYTSKDVSGICPHRRYARYFRANVKIPAAATWVHAVGVEPYYKVGGHR